MPQLPVSNGPGPNDEDKAKQARDRQDALARLRAIEQTRKMEQALDPEDAEKEAK